MGDLKNLGNIKTAKRSKVDQELYEFMVLRELAELAKKVAEKVTELYPLDDFEPLKIKEILSSAQSLHTQLSYLLTFLKKKNRELYQALAKTTALEQWKAKHNPNLNENLALVHKYNAKLKQILLQEDSLGEKLTTLGQDLKRVLLGIQSVIEGGDSSLVQVNLEKLLEDCIYLSGELELLTSDFNLEHEITQDLEKTYPKFTFFSDRIKGFLKKLEKKKK